MNCEVQHLDKNMRYRILIINDEQYILDMERSFWKVIFPFFFWIFPSPVFKVEDQDVIEQLMGTKIGKTDKSKVASLGGLGYGLGILLAPLVYFFETSNSLLVNTLLLILAFILVVLLNLSISHKRKKKLYDVVDLEALQKDKLWVRPNSIKHVFKFSVAYVFLLGFVLICFVTYIQIGNLLGLMVGSGLLFGLLLYIRITVEEGNTTVKFIKYKEGA